MQTITYATDIGCEYCIKTVGFYLNNEVTVEDWDVDTAHPDKLLAIRGKHLNEKIIQDLIQKAGFTIQRRTYPAFSLAQ